jgi:hypothetical protein
MNGTYICIAPVVFAPVVTANSRDSNQQIFSKQIWTCKTSDCSAVYNQTIHAWAACGVLASPCATENSFTDSFVNGEGNCRESWSNMSTTWLHRRADFWPGMPSWRISTHSQDASTVDTAVQSALDRGLHTAPGSKIVEWGGSNPLTAQKEQQRWLRVVIVTWCGLIGVAAFTSRWGFSLSNGLGAQLGPNGEVGFRLAGVVFLVYSLIIAKSVCVYNTWGGEWAKGSTIEMANEGGLAYFIAFYLLNPLIVLPCCCAC